MRRSATLTLLTLLLMLPALPARAEAPRKEQHLYSVTYNSARVAAVQLHSGCPTATYRPTAMVATSAGLIDAIVTSFLIRFDSFLSLTPIPVPREAHSRITEDGVTRTYRTTFSPALTPRIRANVLKKDYDWRLPELPARPHDMISWVYALRARDTIAAGDRQRFLVWDGWKLFWLNTSTAAASTLITPAGSFKAYPIRLTRQRIHHDGDPATKLFKPSREAEELGTLWLRDDAAHTPVGIDFASPIGHVLVRLERSTSAPCDPGVSELRIKN
jgi:hypothetical protein